MQLQRLRTSKHYELLVAHQQSTNSLPEKAADDYMETFIAYKGNSWFKAHWTQWKLRRAYEKGYDPELDAIRVSTYEQVKVRVIDEAKKQQAKNKTKGQSKGKVAHFPTDKKR